MVAADGTGRRLKVQDGVTQVQVTCPFHKGGWESHPSCTMRTDVRAPELKAAPGVFYCFQCGETGWLAHYVAGWLGSERLGEAWCRQYGWTRDAKATEPPPPPPPPNVLGGEVWEGATTSPYLEGRGIAPAIVRLFEVRETPEGVRFPVRDEQGRVVGWQLRGLRKKFFENAPGWEKRYTLYGLWQWQAAGVTTMVICESIIDALTLWSDGHPAVALCGASVSERQWALISRSGCRHAICATDADAPGERVWARMQTWKRQMRVSRWPFAPGEHDVNSQTPERREICWQWVTGGLKLEWEPRILNEAERTPHEEGQTLRRNTDVTSDRIKRRAQQISTRRNGEMVSIGE